MHAHNLILHLIKLAGEVVEGCLAIYVLLIVISLLWWREERKKKVQPRNLKF
jgi:hypothetical protein